MDPDKYINGFNKLTEFITKELHIKDRLSREQIHQMLAEKVYVMTKTNTFGRR